MTRFLKLSAALSASLALFAAPALAGQAVMLKAEPVDNDGVVTLADLFDGAGAAGNVAVASKPGSSVILDAGAVQAAARKAGLDWGNSGGLRRIVVRAGAPATAESAKGNVEVLTYARNINSGDIVQAEDLVWAKVAGAPADAPSDAEALAGMVARKPLRSGAVASTRDVTAPQVIKIGDMVNVTYSDGYVSVSLTGKAMASATMGATVAVQNPSSKKIVSAIATGPGEALIGPAASRFRANRQYAAR